MHIPAFQKGKTMERLTIPEIKKQLAQTPSEKRRELLQALCTDERKGVQTLIKQYEELDKRQKEEEQRLFQLSSRERELHQMGYKMVAGIDEVGRGPLAGPVMAAAVILPPGFLLPGVNDSKQLSPKLREELACEIKKEAIAYGIGLISPEEIDRVNIGNASLHAMEKAVEQLPVTPEYLLVDAFRLPHVTIPQEGIIKGDEKSISIAAASIVAKVERDRLMEQWHHWYPEYGFDQHKGYGSRAHIAAIGEYGLCPIHRRSFVKNIVGLQSNKQKGDWGETFCAEELIRQGYQISERNYHGKNGEIDMIATKDGYTVFIEVKLRTSSFFGEPAEAVNGQKMKKIWLTAQEYLQEKELYDTNVRFDVAEVKEVNGRLQCSILKNAFGGEDI